MTPTARRNLICLTEWMACADERLAKIGVLTDVISDHYPVFICIKKPMTTTTFHKIKGRTYRNYNKEVLQTLVTNDSWDEFYNIVDPAELWDFISSTISKHLNNYNVSVQIYTLSCQ